ncbi:DUF262 domain-containing protein [Streptomyces sp. NPDC046994]|uniref:DUF262 domain-containing protein n=1 Tax=Streptomyces sp. NPDC046994 TaxID=3155735 RepID=UPI003451ED88
MTDQSTSAGEVALIDSVDRSVSSVRTRQLDISFNELADMYESGELIIDPEYQRLFRWTPGTQSRLIETLILELPVPPIFLMETEENVYELIDGLQRISSYLNFRGLLRDDPPGGSPLILEDCDIVTELNGHSYKTLPLPLVRRLKRNFIRAEVLRKENNPRLRYYMFKRLNSGGSPLEPQEIRNCTIRLLDPAFNDVLLRLSVDGNFRFCIKTVADGQLEKRYAEELVLRFFAFKKSGADYKHEVGDFLTEYMEAASAPEGVSEAVFDPDRDEADFLKTFRILRAAAETVDSEVGSRIFGSVDARGNIRGQFAVYHFEGFALGIQGLLDRLDPDDSEQMEALGRKILEIKKNPILRQHTGGGKNTASAYRARVDFFAAEISKILD